LASSSLPAKLPPEEELQLLEARAVIVSEARRKERRQDGNNFWKILLFDEQFDFLRIAPGVKID